MKLKSDGYLLSVRPDLGQSRRDFAAVPTVRSGPNFRARNHAFDQALPNQTRKHARDRSMSFLIYFFVLLISAASVLFGLDLISSPLPDTPNVPIGRTVQALSPPPAQERQKHRADERALTPVHPAEPGKPRIQAATSGATTQDEAKPTPAASVAQAPEPATVQQVSNNCDAQACGAAYQSFRASDCSYQPSAGPRRACTRLSGATAWREPKPQQPRLAASKRELRDIERIVRRQPLQLAPSARQPADQGEMSETERIVRRMTRDESGDIPVQAADGSIFIVRKSYR